MEDMYEDGKKHRGDAYAPGMRMLGSLGQEKNELTRREIDWGMSF